MFHSSGTTGQRPSRHFHSGESLAVYEASLWPWFAAHVLGDGQSAKADGGWSAGKPRGGGGLAANDWLLAILTPSAGQAPHSSLAHMFETIRRKLGSGAFFGQVARDGSWTVDAAGVTDALRERSGRGGR